MRYRQWDDHYAARFSGYSPILGPTVIISKLAAKRKLKFHAQGHVKVGKLFGQGRPATSQGQCGIE